MAYIEIEDLRDYLGIEADETADDRLLQGAIEAAQQYIEDETHRRFEAHTETRYYSREALNRWDSTILDLDSDLISVTTLTNGDSASTVIVAANYWLLPRNDSPPYHQIKLKIDISDYWEWDIDCWVSVAGTWGYMETPDAAVVEACKELAAFAYKKKDSQTFDVTAIPEAGVITIPQGIPATVSRFIESKRRY